MTTLTSTELEMVAAALSATYPRMSPDEMARLICSALVDMPSDAIEAARGRGLLGAKVADHIVSTARLYGLRAR